MIIGPTSPVRGPANRDKVKKSTSMPQDFDQHVSALESPSVQPTVQMTNVDPLWALQEVNEFGEKKKKQIKHGHLLIDHLEQIQQALLSDKLTENQLQHLQELLKKEKTEAIDPALAEILSDIELRAAVELAKYST